MVLKMKFCVIGPLSKDRIIITDIKHIEERPGGTAYYSSSVLSNLGFDITLLTKMSEKDFRLSESINSKKILIPSEKTDVFINRYPSRNSNEREQELFSVIDPFTKDDVEAIKNFDFVHVGPLISSDISSEILELLKKNNKTIVLDIQGMVRKIEGNKVVNHRLKDKKFLENIDILKADASEAAILTEEKYPEKAAKIIRSFGVKEILITFGSKGSLIYSGEKFYKIPAFRPVKSIDTTGCGDTYVAGYIAKRSGSDNIEECGRFAAMCATMKIEQGVLRSKKEEVEKRLFLNS